MKLLSGQKYWNLVYSITSIDSLVKSETYKTNSWLLRVRTFFGLFGHCFADGNNSNLVDFQDTHLNDNYMTFQNRMNGSLHRAEKVAYNSGLDYHLECFFPTTFVVIISALCPKNLWTWGSAPVKVMVRICYFSEVKAKSHVQNLHPMTCDEWRLRSPCVRERGETGTEVIIVHHPPYCFDAID